MGEREVTVAHALFHFTAANGRRKMAGRGETIVIDDADFDRGQRFGAFIDRVEQTHGELPRFDFDPDDLGEIESWMRSASPADILAELEAVEAEEGDEARDLVDVANLMLFGEQSRGTEARPNVLEGLTKVANGDLDDDNEGDKGDEGDNEDPVVSPSVLDEDGNPVVIATEPASDRIDDIVAFVGQDPVKAAHWLTIEQGKDQPRPRLVAQLESIGGVL